MVPTLRALLAPALLLVALAAPASASDQTATYTAVNPWSSTLPDCASAPLGLSQGLGGACFTVPRGAAGFRVTLVDDLLGPGFGEVNFCIETHAALLCDATTICGGVAEDVVLPGATFASVVTFDAPTAVLQCGLDAAGWTPTHGTITLAFDPEA